MTPAIELMRERAEREQEKEREEKRSREREREREKERKRDRDLGDRFNVVRPRNGTPAHSKFPLLLFARQFLLQLLLCIPVVILRKGSKQGSERAILYRIWSKMFCQKCFSSFGQIRLNKGFRTIFWQGIRAIWMGQAKPPRVEALNELMRESLLPSGGSRVKAFDPQGAHA